MKSAKSNLKYFNHKNKNKQGREWELCEAMDMLISLIAGITAQDRGISKHQVAHLKCIEFLFVGYTK